MLRWIANNYRTLLWALALALAVWIAAVTSADPDETHALATSIPLEVIGQDPSLVLSGDVPTEVRLALRAPRSVWNVLNSDPHTVRAVLDLSGLADGAHVVKLQIQIDARPVQIVSASPQSASIHLEALATQTFRLDVSISGEAAVGYQVGEATLEPRTVVVAGAKSQVQKVKRARVSIDLNGMRESVDQTIQVQALDDSGQPVPGITLSPQSVHVTLPVNQQGGYRDVAVKVVTVGRVASGYRVTDISVFPPVVTVYASDAQLVNNLPGALETQPLDLRNAQDNITTRLALNLPPNISVVGDQTVLIQAGVSPIESSITLAAQHVEIINLHNGLSAQVSPLSVDVIVSGPLPLLDTITRQDVRITVDLSGLEPGTHQITPKVEVLISNVTVESILPNTIEVVISKPGGPAATPTP